MNVQAFAKTAVTVLLVLAITHYVAPAMIKQHLGIS